tara:strand:+ start:1852 stop:2079 length:228 start_codon:yes stop_codon:yes gene_type:complete
MFESGVRQEAMKLKDVFICLAIGALFVGLMVAGRYLLYLYMDFNYSTNNLVEHIIVYSSVFLVAAVWVMFKKKGK